MSFLDEMRKLHIRPLTDAYENFKDLMRDEMIMSPSPEIFIAYKQHNYDFSNDIVKNFIKNGLYRDGFRIMEERRGNETGFCIYIYKRVDDDDEF